MNTISGVNIHSFITGSTGEQKAMGGQRLSADGVSAQVQSPSTKDMVRSPCSLS